MFMGMGSKPFMNIQPREAAVHDRTITGFLQEGGANKYDLIHMGSFFFF